ncbi:uncharacterized protein isoform X2 [Choristoneura fumiferana]|uniref:uncharacterized protein isoform X2 n=1 Tax=Choristoneura fumiferana TaxID=7141 RepID=UPI003D15DCD2
MQENTECSKKQWQESEREQKINAKENNAENILISDATSDIPLNFKKVQHDENEREPANFDDNSDDTRILVSKLLNNKKI